LEHCTQILRDWVELDEANPEADEGKPELDDDSPAPDDDGKPAMPTPVFSATATPVPLQLHLRPPTISSAEPARIPPQDGQNTNVDMHRSSCLTEGVDPRQPLARH